MRFLRRHQCLLFFLAVLAFSCVMVLKQYIANQSAHVDFREDFILLHDRGEAKACERLYQGLIEQLPGLSDRSLLDDLQRTSLLVDPKSRDLDNLVWKYHVSVKNELQQRAKQHLGRALQRADKL